LSRRIAKREAKKVSCIGMKSCPPSDQEPVHTLGLVVAADREREIRAAHGLIPRDISSQKLGAPEVHSDVENLAVPVRRRLRWRRLLAVSHQHRDLSAEMLFVETEGLLAVASVIEIGV
jgi:hypothetical protein